MKKILKFTLASIIIFILMLNIKTLNVKADDSNLDFEFQNEILYDNPISNITKTWNVRNQTIVTPYYNGTYGFDNDSIGSVPIGWNDESTGVAFSQVINGIGVHGYVTQVHSGALAIDDGILTQNFDDGVQVSGSIDFWIISNDTSWTTYIHLIKTSNALINIRIVNNLFQVHTGSWQTLDTIPLDDTWYNIRIDFECGGGGYKGLSDDEFDIYINTYHEGTYDFSIIGINIEQFKIFMDSYQCYNSSLDAVGYTWSSNYTLGNNLIPMKEYTGLQEPDLSETFLKKHQLDFDKYDAGDDIPYGFDRMNEYDSGDLVNIAVDPNDADDNVLHVQTTSTGYRGSFWRMGSYPREGFITETFFNITLEIEFLSTTNQADKVVLEFYSFDDTKVLEIKMEPYTKDLYYVDDGEQALNLNLFNVDHLYKFNFMINYDLDACILMYYDEGVYQNTYYMPLLEVGKYGLCQDDAFKINGLGQISGMDFNIDSVGLYFDYQSYFGYCYYIVDLNTSSWDYRKNCFFEANLSNAFYWWYGYTEIDSWEVMYQIHGVEGDFSFGDSYYQLKTDIYEPWKYVTYWNQFRNIYDDYSTVISNPSLMFFTYSPFILENNSFYIHGGNKLVEGSNEYYLSYEYENIDNDVNYFWIDNNTHRLYYKLTCNDTNLEYIQANISLSISAINRTIVFTSYREGSAYGQFRVNYGTTSLVFTLPTYLRTFNSILTQDQTVIQFIILISDNDDDIVLGDTIGYIDNLMLPYGTGLSVTIITLSLINMIIPLIVIFIPTLAIYKQYGKRTLIPMFIFMSLICFISDLIPIWLFVIIVISNGTFLFLKERKERGI